MKDKYGVPLLRLVTIYYLDQHMEFVGKVFDAYLQVGGGLVI